MSENEVHDTDAPVDDYYQLSPERVLDAVESLGFAVDGRFLILNSYENRVYQVYLHDAAPIVAKFYRPNRWSDDAIREEHRFTLSLQEQELPVIAPWVREEDQETLFETHGYRLTIYPCRAGQAPEPGDLDQLYRLGGLLGRIHAIGATQRFEHRPTLTVERFCIEPSQRLLETDFIPREWQSDYEKTTKNIIEKSQAAFSRFSDLKLIRTHGDFHLANIIWNRDDQPFILDFDDCSMAPAVQDVWMLLNGDRQQRTQQLSEVIEGYESFYDFNRAELALIEIYRALRMVYYAGWLAKRWNDPAFPKHFPWFNTPHYWQQHVSELIEQEHAMDEPALQLY